MMNTEHETAPVMPSRVRRELTMNKAYVVRFRSPLAHLYHQSLAARVDIGQRQGNEGAARILR